MHVISVHNVNQGLAEGLRLLINQGIKQDSRNGPVLVYPGPVCTIYKDPTARVLFSPKRNANPFFHLMEALWMLSGRNDLSWPRTFASNMKNYSDDGKTLHGAYGYRWRQHFGFDQLRAVIDELRKPLNRRAVLTVWDPRVDLGVNSLDIPCNDLIMFSNHTGALDMTVCCRSNDIWWGCYGSNAVHFSILLEYIASAVGLPVGNYYQMSNNFHLYTDVVPLAENVTEKTWGDTDRIEERNRWALVEDAIYQDRYTEPHVRSPLYRVPATHAPTRIPLFKMNNHVGSEEYELQMFDACLERFMEDAAAKPVTDIPFFEHVARPMYRAWVCYKIHNLFEAEQHAMEIKAGDWQLACVEWLERRKRARLERSALKRELVHDDD